MAKLYVLIGVMRSGGDTFGSAELYGYATSEESARRMRDSAYEDSSMSSTKWSDIQILKCKVVGDA